MPVEHEQIARAQQIRNGLDQLKASLDYDAKKKEIGEIEDQMAAPGFWDDQEKSQSVVSRIKSLKALVKPMDEIIKELDEREEQPKNNIVTLFPARNLYSVEAYEAERARTEAD